MEEIMYRYGNMFYCQDNNCFIYICVCVCVCDALCFTATLCVCVRVCVREACGWVRVWVGACVSMDIDLSSRYM